MAKKKKMVILGARDANGNKITPKKRMMPLHMHPDSIKQSIDELIEMSEEEGVRFLFEDIKTLVLFALEKVKMVTPPKKEEGAADATPTSLVMEREQS